MSGTQLELRAMARGRLKGVESMLTGKTIVLGVCGGIAAYKAVELLRLLVKGGAQVHVVMTASSREFVTPLTFQTLSGNPVHTEMFNLLQEMEIGHISLADRADLFVVAPATANVIGKVANGIADDLLTTTIMATKAPILFVPAMNVNMYENPIYRRNEDRLAALGCRFMTPATGFLACGWEGKGKLPEPSAILTEIEQMLSPQDFSGETMLVTAGPTREDLDPVRFLSNRSSGRMGYAVAAAARRRGARVVLVSGPTCLAPPAGVETVPVTSARQMREAVLAHLPAATVVVKAAAVADYRAAAPAGKKIKKGDAAELVLALEKNPDILAELGALKEERILVGFAAETDDLLANADRKLREKNLDLIVANDVTLPGAGFDVETNIVRLLYRDGKVEALPQMSKNGLADLLLDRLLTLRRRS
ncbi:MAG: bifunctional phosphopantothenoylcysteine decarboxylase/phosphopantothenate--cysteine ligase CoaBC [Desulfuromonadales bacterium]